MIERTLGIIKPDAVAAGHADAIFTILQTAGFTIEKRKQLQLTPESAAQFYHLHRDKPFFASLITYMTTGAIIAFIVTGEDAVKRYREIIGATDPQTAAAGTLRQRFGRNKEANALHGSDSLASASNEIKFFFAPS